MSYRENVEQAAVALKRGEDANWELARLTFENTYTPGRPSSQPERVSMKQWCADVQARSGIRFSETTCDYYKRLWVRHGALLATHHVSWYEAYEELQADLHGGKSVIERFADAQLRSATQHASPAVKTEALHGLISAPDIEPQAKREVFQQLARDPDVIQEAAMLGTPTSRAVSDLYTKTERVREEFREREIEADPIGKRLDQVGAALDLEAACNRFAKDLVQLSERFAREINEALPRAGAAREEHLYWVKQAIERARSVLSELEGYAETGRTDLDTFLADVLGGR